MSDDHDPFAPPKEEELSLELGVGYEIAAKDKAPAQQADVLDPLELPDEEALNASFANAETAESRQEASSALWRASQELPADRYQGTNELEDENEAPVVEQSYAERHAADRMAYWQITRIPVLILLGWFTLSHVAFNAAWVFVDHFNLVLHEAGHPLLRWGGDTIYFLGGTLFQLFWPVGLACYFFWKRKERFAAIVCVWWAGENLMNISRYMRDAPTQDLPLVGGDTHDWNYLYTKWDAMSKAIPIANFLRTLGVVIMLGTMAYLVWMTIRPTENELDEGFRA